MTIGKDLRASGRTCVFKDKACPYHHPSGRFALRHRSGPRCVLSPFYNDSISDLFLRLLWLVMDIGRHLCQTSSVISNAFISRACMTLCNCLSRKENMRQVAASAARLVERALLPEPVPMTSIQGTTKLERRAAKMWRAEAQSELLQASLCFWYQLAPPLPSGPQL